MRQVMSQLKQLRYRTLRMVLGFMADKDVERILSILPADAQYYFTQAQTPRSLSVTSLTKRAHMHRLYGSPYGNVSEALAAAKRDALATDVIYVGGSMYLLAELFSAIDKQ
jgi:dihydrofolate synthase/folylpolyglutamate synthase